MPQYEISIPVTVCEVGGQTPDTAKVVFVLTAEDRETALLTLANSLADGTPAERQDVPPIGIKSLRELPRNWANVSGSVVVRWLADGEYLYDAFDVGTVSWTSDRSRALRLTLEEATIILSGWEPGLAMIEPWEAPS